MFIVTDVSGKILMWNETHPPGIEEWQTLVELDEAQAAAFAAARQQRNGGLSFEGGIVTALPAEPADTSAEEFQALKQRQLESARDALGKGTTADRLAAIEAFLKES